MSKALDNIGPHLLGRIPSDPDSRNFKLETFVSADPLDVALAKLLADKHVAKGTKEWASFITPYLKQINYTPPVPTPTPDSSKVWEDNEPTLDQGQTGHCVGFSGAQWGNTLPIDDKYTNVDGHSIYYECKIVDGEPRAENGSTIHSLAKVLKNRKQINLYAFADTVDAIKTFVVEKGPIIVGTDWYDSMFYPNKDFYVTPSGSIAGGHAYLLIGYHQPEDSFEFLNSWGDWANNGHFFMKVNDFKLLLDSQGEALASVEVPLESP